MPAQPQIPNLRDVEAQTMRAELFALALQLGDPNASSARLNATFIWLHERLLKHLHTLNDKLETALRDYDPVLANRLEDGTLRLTALLQKLTPRFAELQAGEGADLSRERYSLHLDWNLLLADVKYASSATDTEPKRR